MRNIELRDVRFGGTRLCKNRIYENEEKVTLQN